MQSLEQWKSFYESWAGANPLVASTGHEVSASEFAALGEQLADWAGLTGEQRVLDVGCASGTLTSYWANRAAHVTGVDYCESLLQDGAARHPHIEFVHAEAAALPFADRQFDAVICFGVLLSLPDHDYVDRTLDEIFRVAGPRARIVLGSLPDGSRRDEFFRQLDRRIPWYRRAVPRSLRRAARKILTPQQAKGSGRETKILWFDIDELVSRCRRAGFDVRVVVDPAFAGYDVYRRTLLLTRRDPGSHGASA